MNLCYMLRIFLSWQVFESHTSTAEKKKKSKVTAGSRCNWSVSGKVTVCP